MSKNETLLKPGTRATVSGLYEMVGPKGGKTGKQRTGTKGKSLPPTEKAGQLYRLVSKAKRAR